MELSEINQLMDYLQLPEISNDLSEAGINLPKQEEKSDKWKGKWDYIGNKQTPEGTFRLPTSGGLISRHGTEVLANPGHSHMGIDIGSEKGQPVYSMGPGIVEKTWTEANNKLGGNSIYIKHNNGISSYYAHLDSVNVRPGQNVDENTQIGSVGGTGKSPSGGHLSPHLHFQVRINGQDINPLDI